MSDQRIRRASLAEIETMKQKGELHHKPDAREGESLGPDFWASAELVEPRGLQPVLLKLDPEVFEFFKRQGNDHLTKMQNVLRAYVQAHRKP